MTLRDDLLPDLRAICDFTGLPERRLRHLIAAHGFPVRKIGGRLISRKSWIERYYSAPDQQRPVTVPTHC